jgi:hypothetical protein
MIFSRQNVKKCSMILMVAGLALSVSSLPGLCNKASAASAVTPKAGAAPAATEKIPFPRPDSHKGGWIEFHGASAGLNLMAGEQSCLTCHGRNDCVSCHNTRPPRDHTNTWRTLSHGFMAEGNRERCLTCHRQDFCVRCHNETPPRSHTGGWNNPVRHSMGRPCTDCHGSGRLPVDSCGVCHNKPLQ